MAGATFPRFRLYQNDGTTLVFEFDLVTDWGDSPFLDPITFTEHLSLRGQGSIISEGSQAPFDFPLEFLLIGDDYEDLVDQMNALPNTIVTNTQYVLRIDLTPSTTKDLKVKRLSSILFPITSSLKVVKHQTGNIIFRVNSWS